MSGWVATSWSYRNRRPCSCLNRTRARKCNRQRNRAVGGLFAGGGDARNGGVFIAAHGVAVLIAECDVVEPGVVERGDGRGDALAVQVARNAGLAGLLGNDDGNRGARLLLAAGFQLITVPR
mgnify:CR=1 FL=1